MPTSLANTRSSAGWTARMPGNWDRLNTRSIFVSTNSWGLPDLPPAEWVPSELVPYNSRRQMARARPPAAVHFFLDDYRFEIAWNRPDQFAAHIAPVGGALTPDFSLWREMPMAMQVWQVYRNRWCGAWLASKGVQVIPTVSWSTRESWDFCFEGLAACSVVAVSTVGIVRNKAAHPHFYAGYHEMLHRLAPTAVVVYGKPLPGMEGNLQVFEAPRRVSDGRSREFGEE